MLNKTIIILTAGLALAACQTDNVRNRSADIGDVAPSTDTTVRYVDAVNRHNRQRGIDTQWINMPRAETNKMRELEALLEEDAKLDQRDDG